MNEININSLIRDEYIINIRDENDNLKQIKFKKLSVMRAFDIAEKYNKIIISFTRKSKNAPKELTVEQRAEYILSSDLKYSKKYLKNIINLCLNIIRPKHILQRIDARARGNWISKKYILNNFGTDAIHEFIQLVLKPVIGEKKNLMNQE